MSVARSWLASRGWPKGATQFCRRTVFDQVGGYDEGDWIGEDVDFYWSLKKLAKRRNRTVRFIRDMRVRPSSRRFDKWPIWKILIWTNPLFVALFRRRKRGLERLVLACGEADSVLDVGALQPGRSGDGWHGPRRQRQLQTFHWEVPL